MTLRAENPRRSPLIQKQEAPKGLHRPEPVKPPPPPPVISRADTFQPARAKAPVDLNPTLAPRGNAAVELAKGGALPKDALAGLSPLSPVGALKGKALGTLADADAPRAYAATSDTAAPAAAPTPGAAAAARVNEAYENAPPDERSRVAAETLQREAEALKDDPEARAALYEGSRETIDHIATDLGRRVSENDDGQTQETLTALAKATDILGPEATQQIGESVAKALPEQSDLNQFDDALHDLAEQGLGLNLSTAVVSELGKLGKSQAANELTDVLTQGISTARSQFEEAQAKVDELNQELGYLVQSYGGVLSPEQLQSAVDDFKERHQEDYAALEREAAEFSQGLNSVSQLSSEGSAASGLSEANRKAVQEEANKALVNVFPRLGDTQAGSETIAQALEAQGRGEPSFLDQVDGLAQNLTNEQVKDLASDETEAAGFADLVGFQQGVAETLFKSATLHIAVHPERSQTVLDGLKTHAALLGTDPTKLQTLADDVTALASETDPAEIRRLQDKIRTQSEELEFLDPSTRAGQAFGAFTTVLGVIGAAGDLANWNELDLKDQIGAISGALETGIGAYETILGVAGRASSISSLAGRASGVLGGLGAVLDGISAAEAFQNGDYVGGAGYTATAVGGAVLTAAALSNAVPVAGQIAAGVLIAVGFGLQQWSHVQQANKNEGPAEDFLRGAGLSPKLAEELSNHTGDGFPAGPALAEVAKALNIPPEQLVAHLETLSEDQLNRLIEEGVHPVEMEGDEDDRHFPQTGDDVNRIREWDPNSGQLIPEPDSIEGLALWLERQGYLPAGVQVPA